MPIPRNRFFPASPLQVFAVEVDALQLCWGQLPAAAIHATARPARSAATTPPTAQLKTMEASRDHAGGPGCLEITGLEPDTNYEVSVCLASDELSRERVQLTTKTLRRPAGAQLCKFATISDLHIGARRFGALKTMTDPEPEQEPFAFRCARSAIEDAISWGAEYLIIKGDALHAQTKENMRVFGKLLDEFTDLPMMLLPGNHDVDGRGDLNSLPPVGSRALDFVRGVATHQLPGLLIIGADTTIAGQGIGTIANVSQEILAEGRGADPSFIATHQQLQHHRIHYYWPPGIPTEESSNFLEQLTRQTPNAFLTSGHTHRNRVRRHKDLTLTEVASTRDWPGVWAGYTVYEGGLTQTVRRASAPNALRWHEYGRQALAGLWSLWAPGRLQDRCLVHRW